jgi:hypothetical protein
LVSELGEYGTARLPRAAARIADVRSSGLSVVDVGSGWLASKRCANLGASRSPGGRRSSTAAPPHPRKSRYALDFADLLLASSA